MFSAESPSHFLFFFFFNDTATTEIYTLSLHDALPISSHSTNATVQDAESVYRYTTKAFGPLMAKAARLAIVDRKSTRLNSSHLVISYAVFCLKKKKKNNVPIHQILVLVMTPSIVLH